MPARARMAAHAAAGQALEQVYRGAIEAHLPELAHHYLSADTRGDLQKAVDYAQRAAERALDGLAFEQAAELYSRALEVLERLELDVPRRAALLLGLGTAQSRAGRPAARATFELAIAAARSVDAHEMFARAALGAAPFALTPGFVDEQHVALLDEALNGSAGGPSAARAAALLARAGAVLVGFGEAPGRSRGRGAGHGAPARRPVDGGVRAVDRAVRDERPAPHRTGAAVAWRAVCADRAHGRDAAVARCPQPPRRPAARGRRLRRRGHRDRGARAVRTRDARSACERLRGVAARASRRDRRPLPGRARPAGGRRGDQRRVALHDGPPVGRLAADRAQLGPAWARGHRRERASLRRRRPRDAGWRAVLAATLAATGRTAEAQLEFDRLAAGDYAALPRDSLWFGTIAALTEAVIVLDLPERARELYELLTPFAARNIVTPTVAFLGPVEMWLGILARVGGDPKRALEHLGRARVSADRNGARMSLLRIAVLEAETLLELGGSEERMRAGGLLAQAGVECEQLGYLSVLEEVQRLGDQLGGAASAPAAPAPPAHAGGAADHASLKRVGDVWTIDDGRQTLHLNDGRGVRLLALLLERPGKEVHSLELAAIVDGTAVAGGAARSSAIADGLSLGGQSDAGPQLDAEAKAAYRARLEALQAEIDAARARGDETHARRAREELEFVQRELEKATGLGGRDRGRQQLARRARTDQRHARGSRDAQAHLRLPPAPGARAAAQRQDRLVLRLRAGRAQAAAVGRRPRALTAAAGL